MPRVAFGKIEQKAKGVSANLARYYLKTEKRGRGEKKGGRGQKGKIDTGTGSPCFIKHGIPEPRVNSKRQDVSHSRLRVGLQNGIRPASRLPSEPQTLCGSSPVEASCLPES